MFIIWGSHTYGKTDEVPGLFHVESRFGHIWFIPLIPLGSMIVLGRDADGIAGVPISLSGKSVLLTYARWLLLPIGTFCAISGVVQTSTRPENATAFMIAGAIMLAISLPAIFLPQFKRASYERAAELVRRGRLGSRAAVLVDVGYGIIDAETADQAMADIEAREEQDYWAEQKRREEVMQRSIGRGGQWGTAPPEPPAWSAHAPQVHPHPHAPGQSHSAYPPGPAMVTPEMVQPAGAAPAAFAPAGPANSPPGSQPPAPHTHEPTMVAPSDPPYPPPQPDPNQPFPYQAGAPADQKRRARRTSSRLRRYR